MVSYSTVCNSLFFMPLVSHVNLFHTENTSIIHISYNHLLLWHNMFRYTRRIFKNPRPGAKFSTRLHYTIKSFNTGYAFYIKPNMENRVYWQLFNLISKVFTCRNLDICEWRPKHIFSMQVQVSAQWRLAWTPNLRRHCNDVILPAGLLLDVTAFTTSKI